MPATSLPPTSGETSVTRTYAVPWRKATSIAPPTGATRRGRQSATTVVSPVSGSIRVSRPATPSVTYSAPSGPTVLPEPPSRPDASSSGSPGCPDAVEAAAAVGVTSASDRAASSGSIHGRVRIGAPLRPPAVHSPARAPDHGRGRERRPRLRHSVLDAPDLVGPA